MPPPHHFGLGGGSLSVPPPGRSGRSARIRPTTAAGHRTSGRSIRSSNLSQCSEYRVCWGGGSRCGGRGGGHNSHHPPPPPVQSRGGDPPGPKELQKQNGEEAAGQTAAQSGVPPPIPNGCVSVGFGDGGGGYTRWGEGGVTTLSLPPHTQSGGRHPNTDPPQNSKNGVPQA